MTEGGKNLSEKKGKWENKKPEAILQKTPEVKNERATTGITSVLPPIQKEVRAKGKGTNQRLLPGLSAKHV